MRIKIITLLFAINVVLIGIVSFSQNKGLCEVCALMLGFSFMTTASIFKTWVRESEKS